MKTNKEIEEAKRKLLVELLKCQKDWLTDNEVDIMFYLSKDEDIQKMLDKNISKT